MSDLSEYVAQHTIDKGMSINQFAQRAEIGFETARSLLNSTRIPKDDTLERIAAAFPEISLAELRERSGRPAPVRPFEVPPEVNLLTEEQQHVLRQVLRLLARQFLQSAQPPATGDVGPNSEEATVTPIRDDGRRTRVNRAARMAPMGESEH